MRWPGVTCGSAGERAWAPSKATAEAQCGEMVGVVLVNSMLFGKRIRRNNLEFVYDMYLACSILLILPFSRYSDQD